MGNIQPEKAASVSSVKPRRRERQRTEWAERKVEEFLSLPFVSEFVFRSVRTREGRKEEEVADYLVLHRNKGILIELKCQEDPASRSTHKTELWARKSAKAGWSQLRRAFTRPKGKLVWCDHPRRMRKEFPDGLPPIQHGIVLVEVSQPVDLEPEAGSLPLEYADTPITYLSANDFLNLAVQLRSVPELLDYLTARRSLPRADLRVIGDERALFGFYLLNDGSLSGCAGRADARITVAAQENQLRAAFERKFESDRYAFLLEDVADQLATRDPRFEHDLLRDLAKLYDPRNRRANYLEMQAALADLRYRERSVLGSAFRGAIERIHQKDRGFTFMSARLDSKPDWVYVFGASRKWKREDLVPIIVQLMCGAMAFYEKPKGLFVVDRDGESYEVALSRPGFNPAPEFKTLGAQFFGGLRVTSAPLHFLPERLVQ